jgi:hypothetical protein
LLNFETGSDFSTRDPFACAAALRGCNIWGEVRCSLKIGEEVFDFYPCSVSVSTWKTLLWIGGFCFCQRSWFYFHDAP